MPTMKTGARDAYTFEGGQQIRDVDSKIALKQPFLDPFVALMTQMNQRRTAYAPKVEYYEDELVPWTDTAASTIAADAGVTSLTMGHNYHLAGDILFHPGTGERARISSFNSTSLVATIVRNWGSHGLGIWTSGDAVFNLGPAAEENGTPGSALSTIASAGYNYIQEFKTPVEVSDIQKNSLMYGGNDLEFQRAQALKSHKLKREMAFLYGIRADNAGTTNHIRTMGGIINQISTNTSDAGNTFTEQELNQFCEKFTNGSNSKLVLCSARALTVLGGWAQDRIQLNPDSKKYGIQIFDYLSPTGIKLNLVWHRLLTGTVYGGYMVFVDLNLVKYVTMNNMGTKLHPGVQTAGQAGVKDEWRTACSLQINQEAEFGYIYGIVG